VRAAEGRPVMTSESLVLYVFFWFYIIDSILISPPTTPPPPAPPDVCECHFIEINYELKQRGTFSRPGKSQVSGGDRYYARCLRQANIALVTTQMRL
jgi:hypothetical protein